MLDGGSDLDTCGNLWRPRGDNADEGCDRADFVENLLLHK